MIGFDHSMLFLKDKNASTDELTHTESGSTFRTFVPGHLDRIAKGNGLHKMAMLRYYSVVESFARFTSHIITSGEYSLLRNGLTVADIELIEATPIPGGIEAWADTALKNVMQKWDDVYGGKAGLVEVSLIRNAVTHGVHRMTKDILDAAEKRNTRLPFAIGDDLVVSFELLNEYRGRLRSFCRIVSDGLVHLEKGTHRSKFA